eukprot:168037_1
MNFFNQETQYLCPGDYIYRDNTENRLLDDAIEQLNEIKDVVYNHSDLMFIEKDLKDIDEKYNDMRLPKFMKALPNLLNGNFAGIQLTSDSMEHIYEQDNDSDYEENEENEEKKQQ